jgi:hypothetical protein
MERIWKETGSAGVAVHRLVDLGRQGLPCLLTRPISGGSGGCQVHRRRAKPVAKQLT